MSSSILDPRSSRDCAAGRARCDAIRPAGSPAAVSYRRRIVEEPAFTIDRALGRAPATICRS